MEILLLNSENGAQSGASGYGQLATAIPGAELISVQRREPTGFLSRICARLTRLGAASTWFRPSSFDLERSAVRRLRENRFDIVHLLWGDSDLGHPERLRINGARLVLTIHNVADYLASNFPSRNILRKVDGFILMAPEQQSFLLDAGVPRERCRFIPHGINCEVFRPCEQQVYPAKVKLVHVGSYLRDFEVLAELTHLLGGYPVEFHILTSRSIREQHGFADNVIWYHGISQVDLVKLYQSGQILLMTAKAATANNALLEGMACGLPVVCQNIEGLKAYVTPECAEVAVDCSAEALAKVIRDLLANPDRLSSMARAARMHAESLSWESVAELTRQFYKDLLRCKV
jgi:glycosyltransferase involved in cell wall biosynthesis